MTAPRQRADRLLVERGLFESRAKAQAAIAAGLVTANDVAVRKASEEIPADARLNAPAGASLCLARRGQARGGARPFRLRSQGPRLPRCRRLDRRLHPRAAGTRRQAGLCGRCRTRAIACKLARAAAGGCPGRNRHPHPLPRSLRRRGPTWSPSTSASSRSSWCCPPRWRWRAPPAQLVALIKPQFEAGRAAREEGHRARRRSPCRRSATIFPRP